MTLPRPKLGLYGGSFDPIHQGHIAPVQRARKALGLDRVLYLPTAQPPHKEGPRSAPPLARYTMVELALLEEEGLFVAPTEMERQEVAYTVDTLEHYRGLDDTTDLVLLLGADSFLELERWVRWHRIVELAELAVLPRPGYGGAVFESRLTPALRHLLDSGRAHRITDPTLVDLSSTSIRARFAADTADLSKDVPPLVLDYIAKYELYR